MVVVADMSQSGLLLRVEGIRACGNIPPRGWNFGKASDGVKTNGPWVKKVGRAVKKVLENARRTADAMADVSIIASGGFWTEGTREALREVAVGLRMNTTMLDAGSKNEEVFGASMGAAACYNKRSEGFAYVCEL
jgi:hypothetical protein